MRKREGELPSVTDGECTIPSHVVQVDACNGSLRSKRFQSSFCAKIGARAPPPPPPPPKNGRGRGKEDTLARKPHDSGKRPLIFLGCRVIKKLLFSTFERRNDVLV